MLECLFKHGGDPHQKLLPQDGGNILNFALSRRTKNRQEEVKKDEVLKVLVKYGALS